MTTLGYFLIAELAQSEPVGVRLVWRSLFDLLGTSIVAFVGMRRLADLHWSKYWCLLFLVASLTSLRNQIMLSSAVGIDLVPAWVLYVTFGLDAVAIVLFLLLLFRSGDSAKPT